MDHLNTGLIIAQFVVLFASIFNPALSRAIERSMKIISSLHALYEQQKEENKKLKHENHKLLQHHKKCTIKPDEELEISVVV